MTLKEEEMFHAFDIVWAIGFIMGLCAGAVSTSFLFWIFR